MPDMRIPSAPMADAIYPELPAVDSVNQDSFRLQKISELQKRLESEIETRAALYKKYRRGMNALDGVDTALLATTIGLGVGGVGLLSTIIAAPIALGLEVGALGCGLASVGCKFAGRRLHTKAKKHDEIRVLAESKLNTISDHISRALNDNHQISDEEFRLILGEVDKYNRMKAEIRVRAVHAHAAVKIDEAEKKRLIQQGRDEAQAELIKAMGGK